LGRARELNPRHGGAWRYLGETRGVRARWLARWDKARDEDFEGAAKAFLQALELEPRKGEYRLAAERFHRTWAEWKERRGEDPTPVLMCVTAQRRWRRAARNRTDWMMERGLGRGAIHHPAGSGQGLTNEGMRSPGEGGAETA
jgi:hypothetical protein